MNLQRRRNKDTYKMLSSLFSIRPRVKTGSDRLTASTGWSLRILLLGLLLRRVEVDRQSETVTVESRIAWLFHRRTVVPFQRINAVTYGYDDMHPFAGWSEHDAIDRFVVGLKLEGQPELRLFYFVGEGRFANDGIMPDWWHWDEQAFDVAGSQENDSKLFVRALCCMIGVETTTSSLSKS